MEIVDLFIESNKNKFLNSIIKIPKGYDWYFGLILDIDDFDLGAIPHIDSYIEQQCNIIYEKSSQNIKLLKICILGNRDLLVFGLNATPFNNDIRGILKSICKYLKLKQYKVNYLKNFYNVIFSVWGEKQYGLLICDDRAYNLDLLKEE